MEGTRSRKVWLDFFTKFFPDSAGVEEFFSSCEKSSKLLFVGQGIIAWFAFDFEWLELNALLHFLKGFD